MQVNSIYFYTQAMTILLSNSKGPVFYIKPVKEMVYSQSFWV